MSKKLRFIGIILLLIFIILTWNKHSQGNNKDLGIREEPFIVVIDPGHGGKDVGATGTSGLYEKEFTLSLSMKVKKSLEKEEPIQVYMTREEDTFISTNDRYRPKFANELGADLYISIHGNAFESSDVSGTESYYYHKAFKSFAEVMHKNVVSSTGFNDREVRKKNLYVVRDTDMPSVLLEIGYLSNPQEEQIMFNDEFQTLIADSICDGVKEYLKIE